MAAGVGLLALCAQLPILARGAVPLDEGQLVAIADRILAGDVLYRDIYTGIFPGIYYLTAGLFGVFGPDVVVTRWAAAFVNAATAALLFAVGSHAMGTRFALLAPLLYTALVPFAYPALTMFNYSPLALLFALGALFFLLRYLASGRLGEAVAAGLLLGACGLVKQNFGAYAAAAITLGLAFGRLDGPAAARGFVRPFALVALCAIAPALAAGAALASAGALTAFTHDTVLALGASQLEAFNDPIPPILGAHPADADDPRFVFAYTPSSLYGYLLLGERLFGAEMTSGLRSAAIRIAYGGSLATLSAGLLLPLVDRRAEPAPRAAARVVVIFAALLFLGLFPSAIWSHLAYVLAPILLVLGLLADRVAAAADRRSRPLARGFAAACAGLGLAALVVSGQIAADLRRWYAEPLGVPRASLLVSPDQKALLRGATRFLSRCARPEEPVFVAPDMPLVYFLANRRNPTPYDLVIPGAIDGARIVERLVATGTRCVVYNPKMYLQFAAFDELFPEVAAHLASSYRRAAVISGPGSEWWALVGERKRGS
ncbi:MAG: glycosyltransferase family 39 protein [Myxococcota bacterium]|nr:glycosyltransferase family 39 protein [Myxococcota bacterium]